jgi:hypothetical protein
VRPDQARPPAERFWPKVDKGGPVPARRPDLGPCWIWKGALADNGYGRFNVTKKLQRPAHAFSLELSGVELSPGDVTDHLCLVKACVRPDHLERVPQLENLRRADAAYGIRTAVTHCPQQHEYTPENTRAYRGRRYCRTCERDKARERMRRKRAHNVGHLR